eukprot:TRINITY_DN7374_c0_g1_i3.p1 TRINITY_DN7374_c0_g1~~TRINITY_DN7374_c0_g1_i3.p1  ORF type:complete len:178 (-),score=35.11 TRINITY_DN7374_c0_g1_i3:54-563(-)
MLVSRVNATEWKTVQECEEFKHLEQRPFIEQAFVMYNSNSDQPNATSQPHPYYQNFDISPIDDDEEESPVIRKSSRPSGVGGQYSQVGYLNSLSGKVQASTADAYWISKGLPTDKDGRMLAHYLDVDAYQEQMRLAAQDIPKRKKVTKKMIKHFKAKKEDKKRRRFLMM